MTGNLAQVKKLFFTEEAVIHAMDAVTRRALSRFGAFVRQTARHSIHSRDGVSAPGRPPHSHTGLLKRFIFFSYDPGSRSVVIGPARLNGYGQGEAPALLEYGGRTTWSHLKQVGWYGSSRAPKYERVQASVYVRPRPYMGPAFEKEKAKLPEIWRNSIGYTA